MSKSGFMSNGSRSSLGLLHVGTGACSAQEIAILTQRNPHLADCGYALEALAAAALRSWSGARRTRTIYPSASLEAGARRCYGTTFAPRQLSGCHAENLHVAVITSIRMPNLTHCFRLASPHGRRARLALGRPRRLGITISRIKCDEP